MTADWARLPRRRDSGTGGRAEPPKDLRRSSSAGRFRSREPLAARTMIPLSPTLAHQVQRPRPLGSKQDGGLSFAPSAGSRAGIGDAKAPVRGKGLLSMGWVRPSPTEACGTPRNHREPVAPLSSARGWSRRRSWNTASVGPTQGVQRLAGELLVRVTQVSLARISHHPLGGWIIGCELECFFLSVAFTVEPGPVGGWS